MSKIITFVVLLIIGGSIFAEIKKPDSKELAPLLTIAYLGGEFEISTDLVEGFTNAVRRVFAIERYIFSDFSGLEFELKQVLFKSEISIKEKFEKLEEIKTSKSIISNLENCRYYVWFDLPPIF